MEVGSRLRGVQSGNPSYDSHYLSYLVRRSPKRVEIRESYTSARGPRSRVLASFYGALTPDTLERAAGRAERPFDAEALVRRAHSMGIPVQERSREPEARALLARLRRSDPLDAAIALSLRRALADLTPEAPVPDALADVAEWAGASFAARGAALRELLDLYGEIAASRPARREREQRRFPCFSSQDESR